MELKVAFEGLPELKKAFDLLPKRVAVKASSKAVREGAKVIQKAARAKVPKDTGQLKRSIIIKVLNRRRDAMQVAALIGPASGGGKNDGFYGPFVEYGTKAHLIKPNKKSGKKALANQAAGKFFGKEVKHPGIPFQPFMRPAYDENVVAAQQAIMDVIGEAIETEAKKLYRGK